MSEADFEMVGRLHARHLVTHVPPDTRIVTERSDMAPAPGVRLGLPTSTEPGGSYENVVVEKRLAGTHR